MALRAGKTAGRAGSVAGDADRDEPLAGVVWKGLVGAEPSSTTAASASKAISMSRGSVTVAPSMMTPSVCCCTVSVPGYDRVGFGERGWPGRPRRRSGTPGRSSACRRRCSAARPSGCRSEGRRTVGSDRRPGRSRRSGAAVSVPGDARLDEHLRRAGGVRHLDQRKPGRDAPGAGGEREPLGLVARIVDGGVEVVSANVLAVEKVGRCGNVSDIGGRPS